MPSAELGSGAELAETSKRGVPRNSSRYSAGCCLLGRLRNALHNGNITDSHQPKKTVEQKEGERRSSQQLKEEGISNIWDSL